MLAKKTSKNQLTLPKEIVKEFPDVDYFDAKVRDHAIVLTPVKITPLDTSVELIRVKMAKLGIAETDVRDAVKWARKKKTLRVVLDTNVLVSALVLRGRISGLVDFWRMGRITPVLSKETFDEFRRVLEYPKFSLSTGEIQGILQQEILPFFEVVERVDPVAGVCRDPDDDKFLACAASAEVAFLVSGDKDLCSLGKFGPVRILTPDQFLAILD